MEEQNTTKKLTIKLDLRIVCALLLLVIAGMLAIWQPWETSAKDNRKITINGSSTIKAEPDQYMFNPYYEKDTTVEATALNDQIVKKLKELGVKDSQIKNNASRYGSNEIYYMAPVNGKEKTTLNLTITVDNKELAQKVQDYLLTTNPKGSVTPYPSFSTAKQKELEGKARDEAITDARARADKTANGLGAKIGKVLEVSEGAGGGYPYPLIGVDSGSSGGGTSGIEPDKSISIQPGEDEYTYTVSVVFELR